MNLCRWCLPRKIACDRRQTPLWTRSRHGPTRLAFGFGLVDLDFESGTDRVNWFSTKLMESGAANSLGVWIESEKKLWQTRRTQQPGGKNFLTLLELPTRQLARRVDWSDSVLTEIWRLALNRNSTTCLSCSRLILLMKVLRIRPVVMITPTWRASCRCFRPAKLPKGYPR
jgi:hypothetical protein